MQQAWSGLVIPDGPTTFHGQPVHSPMHPGPCPNITVLSTGGIRGPHKAQSVPPVVGPGQARALQRLICAEEVVHARTLLGVELRRGGQWLGVEREG